MSKVQSPGRDPVGTESISRKTPDRTGRRQHLNELLAASVGESFNQMPSPIQGLKDFESCSSFARDVVSSRPGEPYPPGVVPYDQLPTAACRFAMMPMPPDVAHDA